jgi:hypothetical protein
MTDPGWRKSSYSAGGAACVEVNPHGRQVLIRDTKHSAIQWQADTVTWRPRAGGSGLRWGWNVPA